MILVIVRYLSSLASARLLDSDELLLGTWKTMIRCSPSFFKSELFPPQYLSTSCSIIDESQINRRNWLNYQKSRSFPCSLSIYPNGTFLLLPDQLLEHDCLSVRGEWKVKSNPYCATDRFYDQFIFRSYPRVQHQINRIEGSRKRQNGILQTLTLHFQCRLYGHHSAGRIRFSSVFARGKLTHGSLIVNRQCAASRNLYDNVKRIKARFYGRRFIQSKDALSCQTDEYDEKFFGY